MAQTVTTTYTDDVDSSTMTPAEATTVSWSWRGVDYDLDTRAANLAALESGEQSVTLGQLLAASRRVGGRQHAARPIRGRSTADDSSAAAIREWATANGMPVERRGRIPQHILDAYNNR